MKLVIDIPDKIFHRVCQDYLNYSETTEGQALKAISEGVPLPNVLSELQRELFMNVDGGTDDKYVRCVDVCDRIEKTIQEFLEEQDDSNS